MDILRELGLQKDNSGAYDGEWLACQGEWLESHDPATGKVIARVRQATGAEYEACVAAAHAAFVRWRELPAPKRGEIVRRMGNALREKKDALGRLITLEVGKLLPEGWGEV